MSATHLVWADVSKIVTACVAHLRIPVGENRHPEFDCAMVDCVLVLDFSNQICLSGKIVGDHHMCRSIKPLFNFAPPVTDEEIRAASLQFVRKVSGFNKPSKNNEVAFLAAVEQIAAVSATLLSSLQTDAAPRNRDEEAIKARLRYVQRFPG
jgi:hypothetical protein